MAPDPKIPGEGRAQLRTRLLRLYEPLLAHTDGCPLISAAISTISGNTQAQAHAVKL